MLQRRLVLRREQHGGHPAGRRVVHHSSVGDLPAVEGFVILSGRRLDTVVIRPVGLNHHTARLAASSGPPGCLSQKLKRSLRAPVIWRIQGEIRRHNPHQRHIFKIMPLHNHLGSDKNIRLPGLKGGEDFLMSSLFSGGIRVHPEHSGLGKQLFRHLLQLLGAGPKACDIGRTAGGAELRHGQGIAAVVTVQAAVFVERHGHVAVGTLNRLPAGTAGHKACVASSVHKQHNLLPAAQPVLYLFRQAAAEHGFIACFQLLSQIHHFRLGQAAV